MRTIGIFMLATGILTSVARSQQYAVVDLGTLGGAVSVAKGVNNSGQVTGYSFTPDGGANAFLYTGGTMIN